MTKRFDQQPGDPGPDEFAALAMEELRKRGNVAEYDRDEFALRFGQQVMYLRNFHAEYLRLPPEQREGAVRRMISASVVEDWVVPDSWTAARRSLMPAVRTRSEAEFMRLTRELEHEKAEAPVGKAVVGDLFAHLCVDAESMIVSVAARFLEEWGVSLDEAWDAAIANLRGRSEPRWSQIAPGVFRSDWWDNYDTSRVLLTDLISRLPVLGRPVALLPERDVLIVAGDGDDQTLALAARAAAEAIGAAVRQLSADAIVLDGDAWSTFPLPAAAAVHLARHRLEIRGAQYESSKHMIDRVLKAEGEDVLVPSTMLMNRKDGSASLLVATWPKGTVTLLPEVDYVAMQDGAGVVLVPWKVLREVGIVATPETRWWPPRYRVQNYPASAGMSTLRSSSLKP